MPNPIVFTESNITLTFNWTNSDTTYISAVNSQCKTNFSGCRQLFHLRSPVTMTKAQAQEKFDWVTG